MASSVERSPEDHLSRTPHNHSHHSQGSLMDQTGSAGRSPPWAEAHSGLSYSITASEVHLPHRGPSNHVQMDAHLPVPCRPEEPPMMRVSMLCLVQSGNVTLEADNVFYGADGWGKPLCHFMFRSRAFLSARYRCPRPWTGQPSHSANMPTAYCRPSDPASLGTTCCLPLKPSPSAALWPSLLRCVWGESAALLTP